MSATSPAAKKPARPAKAGSSRRRSEKTPLFRFFAVLVLPFMGAISKISVAGVDKVPAVGPFVLAPNHYSEIDPLVIGIAMWKANRMPRYLAKASLFEVPVLGLLLRKSGQVPVQRAGVTRGADPLAAAEHITENGLAVIIYPEGTLTRDPDLWPMRGKFGAVRMALEAGVPIIPVAHWGTQNVLPRYGKLSLFPRKKIDVLYGDPVDLTAFSGRPLNTATLAEATNLVMNDITALLERLRGEKAPAERWDPSKNHQAETGSF
ncbi:MAG: 1-acyl-sn-glycerol-3-phosphate acyltransferase [Actinomycetota bacterium]|nr:1-acyl-sn-glycerol-3-phosphate acyltransferase [Actinomycetota bacterium]